MNKKQTTDLNELLSLSHDLTHVYYAMIDHQVAIFGDEKKYADWHEGMSAGSAICAGVINPIDKEKNGKQVSVEFRLGMIAGLAIGTNNIHGVSQLLYSQTEKMPAETRRKIYAKSIVRFMKLIHTRTIRFIESHRNQL